MSTEVFIPSHAGDAPHDEPSARLLAEIACRNQDSPDAVAPLFARIGGRLEIHCAVDLEARRVSDVASMASLFRGYESILVRRGLREAGLVSSTASGICGGVHATASALALEMALGVRPFPLGIVARNLLLSCQYLDDNPMQLFVLSGPDYGRETLQRTNPEIWAKAENATAKYTPTHGYGTLGTLMADLDRPSGKLFLDALTMVRTAREAYAILGGKYPHSESFVPGGVNLVLTLERIDEFRSKLQPFVDYAKRCIAIWDEIFEFLVDANPAYAEVGQSGATMVDFGQWDHDEFYDGSYERSDAWGERRWSTPGAIVDGRLVTTRLTDLNIGLEERIEHSYYEISGEPVLTTDPLGNALSPFHPWNSRIQACPNRLGTPQPYSWATAMTWRGRTFEAGAYARLYISALAGKLPSDQRIESTGHSLVFDLPQGDLPALRAEWKVPATWNAFERNRARAYAICFNLLVMTENYERARRMIVAGETRLSEPFEVHVPGRRLGAGYCGAGRGFLAHWAIVDDGVLTNYRIGMPSRINAGPRSPAGELGACEQAVRNTPILETEGFSGIDIQRAIQSFDPCMPCSTRIRVGDDQILERVLPTSWP